MSSLGRVKLSMSTVEKGDYPINTHGSGIGGRSSSENGGKLGS